MSPKSVTIPELGLIAGTRGILGIGIGLLLADRLDQNQRRADGWALVAVGALTTIPLVAQVMFGHESPSAKFEGTGEAWRRRETVAPQI